MIKSYYLRSIDPSLMRPESKNGHLYFIAIAILISFVFMASLWFLLLLFGQFSPLCLSVSLSQASLRCEFKKSSTVVNFKFCPLRTFTINTKKFAVTAIRLHGKHFRCNQLRWHIGSNLNAWPLMLNVGTISMTFGHFLMKKFTVETDLNTDQILSQLSLASSFAKNILSE